MPLDTGAFTDGPGHGQKPASSARPRIALDPAIDVGAALRAARQSLGLTLGEISETTRVRERHLAAIEAGLIDQLPSRPFSIGYVRAYATALGADADATAARYRAEFPSPDDELHTPVGVRHERTGGGRNRLLIGLVVAAVVAVVGWNVTRHVVLRPTAKPPAAPSPRAQALARVNSAQSGPFNVDAPLPAPPEATAPTPYHTPMVGSDAASNAAAVDPVEDAAPTTFVPQGTIYGAPAGASSLIIQAKKSISLEVRGPGGVVYFARQLAAGEAYRAPALPNLTAEVSNPASAELYEGGVSKGPFTAAQMPLKPGG
jgi:cytoskeletal protein RodZ